MNMPANEHLMTQTDKVQVYYPDHPPRTESAVFRATKEHWHKQGATCIVNHKCEGQVEIHHRFIEWADAGGVDWDKVKAQHPNFDWSNFDPAHPEVFIDSIYQTIPLCAKHHRSPQHGIHHLPAPDWQMQQYQRDDFIFSPDELQKMQVTS